MTLSAALLYAGYFIHRLAMLLYTGWEDLLGGRTMQATPSMSASHRTTLQRCPLPATVPFEIHGGRSRGCCLPGEDYLFQGFRYLYDAERDVLVREDVSQWLATQR